MPHWITMRLFQVSLYTDILEGVPIWILKLFVGIFTYWLTLRRLRGVPVLILYLTKQEIENTEEIENTVVKVGPSFPWNYWLLFFRTKIPSQMPLKISTLMSTERYWYDHCRYMNLEMNWFRLRPLLLSANLKIKSEFSDYNQLIKCVLLVDNNKWSLDCNRFIFTWLVTCNFSFKVWA